MSAKPKPEERDTLIHDAAEASLKSAGGDAHKAAALLERKAGAQPKLFSALTEPYLSNACYDAIRSICQVQRKVIWTPPVHQKSGGENRVVTLAKGNIETLLDFPLPIAGLPRLGDATKAMVEQAQQYYDSRATDMSVKAKWLQLIAKTMPDNKKVGAVLDDAALRKLQTKAGFND